MSKVLVVATLSLYLISASGCCGRVCRNTFRKGAYCNTQAAATATPAYVTTPGTLAPQMTTTIATPSTCTTCAPPVAAAPAACNCYPAPVVESGCGDAGAMMSGGYYVGPGTMMSGMMMPGTISGGWVPSCSGGACGGVPVITQGQPTITEVPVDTTDPQPQNGA